MILLGSVALLALVLAAGIGCLVAAAVYQRRLNRAQDAIEVAREQVEDALDQLRDLDWQEPVQPERVVHGLTPRELLDLRAFERECSRSPLRAWRFRSFNRRAQRADSQT